MSLSPARLRHRLRVVGAGLATCGVLAGCTSDGPSPLVRSFQALLPEDTSRQAADLPQASIDLRVNGNGGLFVLATRRGQSTYWQGRDATLVLKHGYLTRTAGIDSDLIATRVSGGASDATPPWQTMTGTAKYRVTRAWRSSDGALHRQTATAALQCHPSPESRRLALQTLALKRCTETLHWPDAATTRTTLWRSPADGRIWAMAGHFWPDSPEIAWQVARPWW
ncbi:YjbF family lipoprotein [Modicisalibacter tunisiensis]|uniref:YjbF family lipoprotein n=1 Tax=Modicisalibacter tunisiensis TaxID=390637 RepID=UPI001CC945D6|nr:YjbF family lipoprotein [Modicisalibacter tunisiensis]MBZ9538030.1 YjbF family lipoprotein [Modicisalibacter tunisiensis]